MSRFDSSMFQTNEVRKSFLPVIVFLILVAVAAMGSIAWLLNGATP